MLGFLILHIVGSRLDRFRRPVGDDLIDRHILRFGDDGESILAGARIRLISDGDVSGVIAAGFFEPPISPETDVGFSVDTGCAFAAGFSGTVGTGGASGVIAGIPRTVSSGASGLP